MEFAHGGASGLDPRQEGELVIPNWGESNIGGPRFALGPRSGRGSDRQKSTSTSFGAGNTWPAVPGAADGAVRPRRSIANGLRGDAARSRVSKGRQSGQAGHRSGNRRGIG